jgi:hypothetical protein
MVGPAPSDKESDGKAGSSALDLPDGIILARWNSTLTNLP